MPSPQDLQLANNAIRAGRFNEAAELLSGVLRSQPGNVQARWMLVQVVESTRQKDRALAELQALLRHAKKDLAVIDRVALHCLQNRYPLQHALRAYKKFLAYQPASVNALFNYAYYLAKDARFKLAIEKYKQALKLGIDTPEEVHLNIANIFMDHLQDHGGAKKHLREALELNPAYTAAYHNLGNLAEQEGDREKASRCFRKCLDIDPANEAALARLADTHRFENADDPLLGKLTDTASNSRNSDVLFALGKAFEQLRDFDAAWEHFSRGNELDTLALPTYRPQSIEAAFRKIAELCDRDWLQRFGGQSHDALFICGMFRTGSTLLEQILAAHPRFQAGGENQFFPRLVAREFPHYPAGLEGLEPGTARSWMKAHGDQVREIFSTAKMLTDKRPDNFLYLGLIKAVLPSAKFIVTGRDWRDAATSIFSVRLASSQNYATSLRHIRHYIGLQAELVEHWASVLGPDLYRISYEDIVREPRQAVGGLLHWLGEEWDDACLEFHGLKNAVKTASVWQVRQPLHAKSVGRWRNYEKHFKKVFGEELDN